MELISREDAIREISLLRLPDNDTNYCVKAHNDAIERSQEAISQTATIESRPTGVWKKEEYGIPHCSECGCINNTVYKNFCPNCGAKMSTPWIDMEGEK